MMGWQWILIVLILFIISGILIIILNKKPKIPKTPVEPTKKCVFEEEDIMNKKLFDKVGTIITEQPKNITCDKCGGYYYKEDTKCVQYMFDKNENTEKDDITGVCTIGLGKSEPCPF